MQKHLSTPKFQFASPAQDAPSGPDWIHEIKYDGYRILCEIDKERVRLITRSGHDWTAKLLGIARAASLFRASEAKLDGEVVVLRPDGTTDFQALQNALCGENENIVYYVFDLLSIEGRDCTGMPLHVRKRLLRQLISDLPGKANRILFSEHIPGEGATVFKEACKLGLEGIVSKRADSIYEGRRSGNWLKVKCTRTLDMVVGGYTPPSGQRTQFGSLLLGLYNPKGEFSYSGRVGTGFSRRQLSDIKKVLRRRDSSPFVNPPRISGAQWVEPDLVVEVEFRGWTADGVLRHASFIRTREDKPPDEARDVPINSPAKRRKTAGMRLTHPEREYYPGIAKTHLARYYELVADRMLPFVKRRPLTLVRCPGGYSGGCFYQKHVQGPIPQGLRAVPIEEKGSIETYVAIEDERGLMSLVQIGVLEIHLWGSREDRLERPDTLIFDLDPDTSVPWERVIFSARLLRNFLSELGLESFVKTSGGKGLHVTVPLMRRNTWMEIKSLARGVAEEIANRVPDQFVTSMSKARRRDRIFIDYFRNEYGVTCIAPYSTRARMGAPVAAPLGWEDLSQEIGPDTYTVRNLVERSALQKSDPWQGYFNVRQSITKRMLNSFERRGR